MLVSAAKNDVFHEWGNAAYWSSYKQNLGT